MKTIQEPPELEDLLEYINETLPKTDRRARPSFTAEADTELFTSGLVDSLAIIHLIAYIETESGAVIDQQMIVMKHFKTPRTIVETFLSK